jgi:hypothetical protein
MRTWLNLLNFPKDKSNKSCYQKVVKSRKVKRTSYTIELKREVVNYAKQHSKSIAANHFNLDLSMVRRWVKASVNWTTETNGKKKKIGSGRKALYPESEKVLYTWIIEQRKQDWP